MPAPLALTSPLTRGKRVRAAQERLRENPFKADYLRGDVDGVFGEETARACRRAKYWLGYPPKEQAPIYGEKLNGYLGGKKLPPDYAKRRQARIKAAAKKPMRLKALEEARKHIGVKESPPGSNRVRFSAWYGLTGPWCAMFTSWCYVQAGSKMLRAGLRYAYVPFVVNDARFGLNGLQVVKNPLPGDLVCYDWNGNGVHDHIGIFESWIAGAEGTEWHAIEGNTSYGNDSNGGEVMRRNRKRTSRPVFVRVGR